MTTGTAVAALALHVDSRAAYVTVLYVDAGTFLACGLLAATLPRVPGTEPGDQLGMFAAARDLPFVAVTLVIAVLNMQYWVIEIAMPLWVVDHTGAPRWMVSVLVAVNTAVAACAVLLAAVLVHVVGELAQASASFFLGFELAAPQAVGQYQGLHSTGFSLAALLGPTVMARLPLRMGVPGWWILGGILLAAALAVGPVVRWAEQTRGRYAVAVSTAAGTGGVDV